MKPPKQKSNPQTPAVFEHEVKIKAEPTFLTKGSISEEDEEYENNDVEKA